MRGQTTLDFAIGSSVFLAVMLFVFTFVPGLLAPFSLSGEADTVRANQIADRLSEGDLGDPEEPYRLDRHCTVSFFQNDTTSPARCRYDGESWRERLDIPETTSVNVTIERNVTVGSDRPDTMCWDETGDELVTRANPACAPTTADTPLTIGESLTNADDTSTITARRVVTVHDEDVTLKVVVW
jgi:hypothetical protein